MSATIEILGIAPNTSFIPKLLVSYGVNIEEVDEFKLEWLTNTAFDGRLFKVSFTYRNRKNVLTYNTDTTHELRIRTDNIIAGRWERFHPDQPSKPYSPAH